MSSGSEVAVEGTIAASLSPEASEEPLEEGHITFAGSEIKKTYKWESKGKVKEQKDGLKVFGLAASIEGTGTVKLTQDEEAGKYQLLKLDVVST